MGKFSKYFLMKPVDAGDYVNEKLSFFDADAKLSVKEIGDGNLNYIFKVVDEISGKSIIVKQAGEALRISEEMKASTDRNRIESEILQLQYKLAPGFVPKIMDYDVVMCACIMEDLSDHQLMRYSLMEHKIFPIFADDITSFIVNTQLNTTDIVMDHKEKKKMVKSFINPDLCAITEDLVLTEPYNDIAGRNMVFTPNKEFVDEELYNNEKLHLEISKIKFEFMNNAQALIHGDLHTGSIFVKENSTRVFDPEFAFYGPIGYDLGNIVANIQFAWDNGYAYGKEEFCKWALDTVKDIIDLFKEKFLKCFAENANDHMAKTPGFAEYYLDTIINDTAAYAGSELIRRTVGMAQVKDVASIEDEEARAYVERINILCGKDYILNRDKFKSGSDFVSAWECAAEAAKKRMNSI